MQQPSKDEPRMGSAICLTKKWLNKPFVRGKKVVDLTGSYSNLAVLNQLVRLFEKEHRA